MSNLSFFETIGKRRGLPTATETDLLVIRYACDYQDEVANYYNANYAWYEKADLDAWFNRGLSKAKSLLARGRKLDREGAKLNAQLWAGCQI